MPKDDLDEVFDALARAEGKSVAELKREMLRDRLAERPSGDAALVRRQDDRPIRYPSTSSPVVRPDYEEETAEEARERWLEEEAELMDGVHSIGGATAGGIFGSGPIATEVYDPMAEQRGEARINTALQARQAQAIGQLADVVGNIAQRLGMDAPQQQLPGPTRRLLEQGRRRRRRR